jgi:hypothetical protein
MGMNLKPAHSACLSYLYHEGIARGGTSPVFPLLQPALKRYAGPDKLKEETQRSVLSRAWLMREESVLQERLLLCS